MLESRGKWSVAAVAAVLATVNALALGEPARGDVPKAKPVEQKLLEFALEGDSVDFVITDPAGRKAVVGVGTKSSEVEDWEVDAIWDARRFSEGDDDSDSDSSTARADPDPVGGGWVIVPAPASGSWTVEVFANRACPDSCEWNVYLLSLDTLPAWREGVRSRLGQGMRAVLRVDVDEPSKRGERVWARVRLERVEKMHK